MRIRKMSFTDYGISSTRVSELMTYCRQSGDMEIVRRAATYASPSPDMTDAITASLTTGAGYLKLIYTHDIDYHKSDFYAYRRLAVALLNVLLTEGDPGFWKAETLADWLEDMGKLRRGRHEKRKHRPATRSQRTS